MGIFERLFGRKPSDKTTRKPSSPGGDKQGEHIIPLDRLREPPPPDGIKQDERLERLVGRLLHYRAEAVFLDALREATALAPRGDDLGVRALSEAIRRRSGKRDISFYTPNFGGLTMRAGEEIMEAEARLLNLAKSRKLLADPAATQNLISAAFNVSSDGLRGLVDQIFAQAGTEQGYDFQLVFNQMHSSIRLRAAQGERSWTQQIADHE